jgi:hypothetical protein
MSVTTYDNATYPTNTTAPEFTYTWAYPFHIANKSAPASQVKPLIHAFPQTNIANLDPLTLTDVGALNVGFDWTLGTGNTAAPTTSQIRLTSAQVNTSVALDMYLDADPDKSGNASVAAFEMIIFFAKYGLQDPVGFGNGTIVTSKTIGGVKLYVFSFPPSFLFPPSFPFPPSFSNQTSPFPLLSPIKLTHTPTATSSAARTPSANPSSPGSQVIPSALSTPISLPSSSPSSMTSRPSRT